MTGKTPTSMGHQDFKNGSARRRSEPPCSFCGAGDSELRIGFRAMICDACIDEMRDRLAQLDGNHEAASIHHFVAGKECVFCERILSTAGFSLRRWIFGVCNGCACSIAKYTPDYAGQPVQSYEF